MSLCDECLHPPEPPPSDKCDRCGGDMPPKIGKIRMHRGTTLWEWLTGWKECQRCHSIVKQVDKRGVCNFCRVAERGRV